jgi:thiol-disulfide isomerase/thioredoxin
MANRQRAEARRKAAAKAAKATRSEAGGSRKALWAGVAVVVALGVVGVVWAATRNSGSNGNGGSTTVGTGASSAPDSMPVKVTGKSLPPEDSTVSPDPAIGMTAPVLVGSNFSRQPMTIDSSKGAYMVVFLAHWCPHCNAEVPRLNDWKHSGAVPANLNVIGVATAVDPSLANYPPGQWISNKGWEWPVMIDQSNGARAAGVAASAFGATGWPYFVIVGADGKVKARASGEVSMADLQKIIAKALAS